MQRLTITLDEGLDTLTTTQIQVLEGKLDIGLSIAGYKRVATDLVGNKAQFCYQKQLNGNQLS